VHGSTFYYLRDSSLGELRLHLWASIPTMSSTSLERRLEGRSSAARRSVCGLRSAHLQCSGGGGILNGSMTVAPQQGTYPRCFGLRVAIRRLEVRPCDQAIVPGCPPAAKVGRPVLLRTRWRRRCNFHRMEGRNARNCWRTGSVKLDRYLGASVSFAAGEHGGGLRTNNVTFDTGSPNYE